MKRCKYLFEKVVTSSHSPITDLRLCKLLEEGYKIVNSTPVAYGKELFQIHYILRKRLKK